MIKKIITITILFLAIQSLVYGKDLSKKHSLDIHLKLGGIYFQNGHPANEGYIKTYGNEVTKVIEGDMEYTFKPKDKIAAHLELEADNNRAGVIRIKEAWFQLPLRSHTQIRFGNSKKDLGFKGSMGSFNRNFFDRSLTYKYLRSFDILDYDIMLRTKVKHQIRNLHPQYILALGADEDQRVFLNFGYSLSIKNSTFLISDLFINHVDTRFDKQNSNHLTIGYKHKGKSLHKSIEFFTGIDPDASNQMSYLKNDRTVYYLASEMELSHLFKINKKEDRITKGFEPIIQMGWLSNDLDRAEDGFLEMRAAFNVLLNKPFRAKWHTGYGYIMQHSNIANEKWTEKSSTFTSVVQICW